MTIFKIWPCALAVALCACGGGAKAESAQTDAAAQTAQQRVAVFNADSAYAYVGRQVAFGPRVPGTPQHAACGQYLVEALRQAGVDTVFVQRGPVTDYTGRQLTAMQIMGQINPDNPRRTLLLAHWDTRPWADQDDNHDNHATPVMGANDGASGVGVLLEAARAFSQRRPDIGVDILFTDCEDSGCSDDTTDDPNTWGLGTQWWVQNMPYTTDNIPRYAILLDMVGGRDAVFHYEGYSMAKAGALVSRFWRQAQRSGYGSRFPQERGGYIVDDHIYIMQAGIPAIDIIESKNVQTGSFAATWHTADDTMENIDASSLMAVGQTLLDFIYAEK